MILKWVKGLTEKPDHPMHSLEETRILLADLPSGNAQKALEELTSWLESLGSAQGFRADEYFKIAGHVDETAQPYLRDVLGDFLDSAGTREVQANRLWILLAAYANQASRTYLRCLEHYRHGAKGAANLKDKLPVIGARAMVALGLHKKLLHFRYRPVEPRIWGEMGALYLQSEAGLFARNLISLYPSRRGFTSVQREFVKGLMFEVSPVGALTPRQIELTERIIDFYTSSFAFGDKMDELTDFSLDPATHKPPLRLGPNVAKTETMRYFGAGMVLVKIQGLVKECQANRPLPPEIDIGLDPKPEELLQVLEPLALHWSKNPPHRKQVREVVNEPVNVAPGLIEIRRRISKTEALPFLSDKQSASVLYQEQLDLRLYGFITDKTKRMKVELAQAKPVIEQEDKLVEHWLMEDISRGGAGVVVRELRPWVKVGTLLGLRRNSDAHWAVGVIRRMARDQKHRLLAGLQIISYQPTSVRLRALAEAEVSVWDKFTEAAQYNYIDGILLLTALIEDQPPSLLVPRGTFFSGRSLLLFAQKEKRLIRLLEGVEEGGDYERVTFQELAMSEGGV